MSQSSSFSSFSRRQARELAFQFVYGRLSLSTANDPATKDEFGAFCVNFEHPSDEFAWDLVTKTTGNTSKIDETISGLSKNWRLERMPKVDLAILRMATAEILFRNDIPKVVTINEAVELAKKFGNEGSASFINGILDKISKE